MVLGNVITEEAEALVGLRDLDALLEELSERNTGTPPVHVIESAKLHSSVSR